MGDLQKNNNKNNRYQQEEPSSALRNKVTFPGEWLSEKSSTNGIEKV